MGDRWMKIDDFNFDLPEELIAQTPLKERSASRLLVVDRQTKELEHRAFTDIKNYLREGDCIVLNDTRLVIERLYGIKKVTGAKLEVLLLHQIEANRWEVVRKSEKKVRVGTTIVFGGGLLQTTYTEIKEHGGRVLKF